MDNEPEVATLELYCVVPIYADGTFTPTKDLPSYLTYEGAGQAGVRWLGQAAGLEGFRIEKRTVRAT